MAEYEGVSHLDDVWLAHVSDAEEKAEFVVSLADDGVLTKQKRLRSLLRSR